MLAVGRAWNALSQKGPEGLGPAEHVMTVSVVTRRQNEKGRAAQAGPSLPGPTRDPV